MLMQLKPEVQSSAFRLPISIFRKGTCTPDLSRCLERALVPPTVAHKCAD
jgi:hypothetical protein